MINSDKKNFNKEIVLKDLVEKSKKHYRRILFSTFFSAIFLFHFFFLIIDYLLFKKLTVVNIIVFELIGLSLAFLFVMILSRINRNKLLSIKLNVLISAGHSVLKLHTESLQGSEQLLSDIEKIYTIESYEICE